MRNLWVTLLVLAISLAATAAEIAHGSGKGWIQFRPYVDSEIGLQALIRQLLEQDEIHKESLVIGILPLKQVLVARHDLNDDGVPEIIIAIESALYCGTVGCEPDVFQKRNDAWEHIGYAVSDGSWVSDEKVLGFRTIYTTRGTVMRWTGKEYASSCAEVQPSEMAHPKIRCQLRTAADPYADERWSALGRYQMRRPALIDIGLLDEDQFWTGKFGIRGWRDFLNNPQGQEAAMAEWAEKMDGYAQDEGYFRHVGRRITGLKGDIIVTEGGLIAAMHNVGGTGLRRYFEWLEAHGWNSRRYEAEMPVRFQPIEARLRAFQDVGYRK